MAAAVRGLGLLAAVAGLPSVAGAEGPWSYRLGERHPARQVNLCESESEARELAGIFRKYGVRPGFAALSNAPACRRRVAAVEPLEVLEAVVVSPDSASEYRVIFVRVRIEGEETHPVLVTTRRVEAP